MKEPPRLLCLGLLAVILSPDREATAAYAVEYLGGTVGRRVNQSGDAVGWATVSESPSAFIHTAEDGLVLLPVVPGRPLSIATDVSDRIAGVVEVVGYAYQTVSDEPGRAIRWRFRIGVGPTGDPLDLGVLGVDRFSDATAVNNAGEIVGGSDPRAIPGKRAFLYTEASGMVDLVSGSLRAAVRDINELGHTAGDGFAGHAWRMLVSPPGTAPDVEDLGADPGFPLSFGNALNEEGQVAGSLVTNTFDQQRVARYTNGAGWEILGGVGETNVGWGIDCRGDVVGEGMAGPGPTPLKAVIYTEALAQLTYLDDLLDDPTGGWSIFAAYDVNDSGQIVGWGDNSLTSESGAVLLTPAAPGICPGPHCDDANACTADVYDPNEGLCVHDPIDCDDFDLCTSDTCDEATGCGNDPVRCPPGEHCDPATGGCVAGSCDGDGLCDGGENCGTCPADCGPCADMGTDLGVELDAEVAADLSGDVARDLASDEAADLGVVPDAASDVALDAASDVALDAASDVALDAVSDGGPDLDDAAFHDAPAVEADGAPEEDAELRGLAARRPSGCACEVAAGHALAPPPLGFGLALVALSAKRRRGSPNDHQRRQK